MTIWKAVLLGLVQGLCEFLPVSSSGHLILLQRMLGVESGAVFFTVMLHVATLVAVLIVYRRMVWQLLCHPFQKTVLYLILALVPTVLVALLFKFVPPFDAFYEAAEEGAYLGVCFLFTGCILAGSDLLRRPRSRQRGLHDMRAADALAEFIAAAREQGLSVYLSSTYRDYATQTYLYNRKVSQYGEEVAKTIVAPPGTSEHQLGLAADITDKYYEFKDESLENTELFQWMSANCADYGFIVRYPKDKEDVTGIMYEPWHFRYVGKEAAAYIMENGLCLEEFVALYE